MKLTKADWAIIFVFLIFAFIVFLFFNFSVIDTEDRILMIQSDSTLYATYNLDLLEDEIELDVNNPKGKFRVLISKDKVCVLESGCEDNICKKKYN